jgi:LuxR family maltose regulon positive regulatory protein
LLHRLPHPDDTPIVSVVAPPGYGKTTLLAQWADRHPNPTAWVSIDEYDNDPNVLVAHMAVALDRLEALDPTVFQSLRSPGAAAGDAVIPRFTAAVGSMTRPFALVLDHVELLNSPPARQAVGELAARLPAGAQLAVGSRHTPPIALPLVRARGLVAELTTDDLVMSHDEATTLLDGVGVHLDADDVAALVERTEGWAAGLYLAALAVKAIGRTTTAGFAFTGDDRLMAEYLRSEFLALLTPEEVSFLTRTSVLDRLSGSLCDAVLEQTGSATRLERLEGSNLLVVPLDRQQQWYRYHRLLRDLLRRELERDEPELVRVLHQRAADWYEQRGEADSAIRHAMDADDPWRMGRLVRDNFIPTYTSGRIETTRVWIAWFDDKGILDGYPDVAVQAAALHIMDGHPGSAERWADAVERAATADAADMPSGPAAGWTPLLRALLARDGIEQMRADAIAAREAMRPGAPWSWVALLLEGVSYLFEDDADAADPILAHAVDAAFDGGATPAVVVTLAERAVVAVERNDWDGAERLLDRALELIDTGGVADYAAVALAFVLGARAAARRADVATAVDLLGQANRLRPRLTYALPTYAVQTRIELAQAYLELDDPAGARVVMREVRDLLVQRPHLGVMPARADALNQVLTTAGAGSVGTSSLTAAELRLVPYLPTHLSFREIGERLFVSRHTIKTQAISIYRKLGVSTRSEAIERMQMNGLLDRDGRPDRSASMASRREVRRPAGTTR